MDRDDWAVLIAFGNLIVAVVKLILEVKNGKKKTASPKCKKRKR